MEHPHGNHLLEMASHNLRSDSPVFDSSLANLRRRWSLMLLFVVFLILLGHRWLRLEWHPAYATRWAILAAGVLVYELVFLWRGLKDNHRQDEAVLLPTLGAGNLLTLLRGLGLGLMTGFLFSPWPSGALAWLPALLYTTAILVDYVDGYLARITRHATVLGANMDIEFDALGMLIVTTLAVHYDQLPWWYLLLGFSRYLFLLGIWWRKRTGKPVYEMPPSVHRRMVAGFQMGFMSVMLWPLFYPPGTTLAGVTFAVPFAASFLRDWLVVSGRLDPVSQTYLEVKHKLIIVMTHRLPVLLRVSVVMTTAGLILPVLRNEATWSRLFLWPGSPFPEFLATLTGLMALLALVFLILGAAGRLAALVLLVAASANFLASGLNLVNGFLLVSTVALMLLGSGAFSCWRPEEAVLCRHAGKKR